MTTHANARGNTTDRRKRRQWILSHYGNGVTAPCWQCHKRVNSKTLVVDRIKPGGSYRRNNIRPHCVRCSTGQGYAMGIGKGNDSARLRVRFSHSDSVRNDRVSKSIMRELFTGIMLAMAILFIFAAIAFSAKYAIPVVIGLVIGTVMDMRKGGDCVTGN